MDCFELHIAILSLSDIERIVNCDFSINVCVSVYVCALILLQAQNKNVRGIREKRDKLITRMSDYFFIFINNIHSEH